MTVAVEGSICYQKSRLKTLMVLAVADVNCETPARIQNLWRKFKFQIQVVFFGRGSKLFQAGSK